MDQDIDTYEDDDVDGEAVNDFYFESDHLALRGNKDYAAVLKTIVILQAQMIQATKDIDKIVTAEAKALEDPEEFVKQLSRGEKVNVPGPINIIEIPKINFDKYNVKIPDYPMNDPAPSTVNDITVNGNLFDEKKPVTHKQLWTTEEQLRLEELLIEYPPEPVEMKRFAKIAKALGNRTTIQVASRIQKYFKKLHSHGLPIPGRSPKSHKPTIPKSLKYYRQTLKPSTFFPAQDVPVKMTEEEDDIFGVPLDANFGNKFSDSVNTSSNLSRMIVVDKFPFDDKDTIQTRVLKLLQKVKNDKEKYDSIYCEHEGFKCDLCSEEPITGTRWHCTTCNTITSIDYCTDCLVTQLMNTEKSHSLEHNFIAYRHVSDDSQELSQNASDEDSCSSENEKLSEENNARAGGASHSHDKDYMLQKFTKCDDYNYLDPNFLPE